MCTCTCGCVYGVHVLCLYDRSYSWSANIIGSKEWLFYPPNQEDKIRDHLGNLPFDLTSVECQEKIKCADMAPPTRVIQRAGEIMFVPR